MESYYFEPNFDPNKATKAELSSILGSHGIMIPTSSKKAELVEAFVSQLLPLKDKIRKEREKKVKPSSFGIVQETAKALPSIKTPTGSEKKARNSTRKKGAATLLLNNDEDDNPFQSGSEMENSTPVVRGKRGTGRARSTAKVANDDELLKSPATPITTKVMNLNDDDDSIDGVGKPSAPSFQHTPAPFAPFIDVAAAKYRRSVIVRKKNQSARITFTSCLTLILLFGASLSLSFFGYFKWFNPIPFCSGNSIANSHHFNLLKPKTWIPECIPCPLHAAKCQNHELICETGFHDVCPLYSIYHSCIPDKRQQAVIDKLAFMIQDTLEKHAGNRICKERETDLGIKRSDLFDIVKGRLNTKKDDPAKYAIFFEKAIGLIKSDPTKFSISWTEAALEEDWVYQSQNPQVPIGCRTLKFAKSVFVQNQIYIYAFFASLFILSFARYRWNQRQHKRSIVDELVFQVLDLLVEQEKRHRQAPMHISASLSVTQLRDSLCQPHSFEYKCWNDASQ